MSQPTLTSREVVSWAGPLERARQALDRASEHFESKRFPDGWREMRVMLENVNDAMRFINRPPPAPREP